MPKKQDNKHQVSVFLTKELYQKVKEYVEQNGMTIQGLFTVLFKRELAKTAKKEEE